MCLLYLLPNADTLLDSTPEFLHAHVYSIDLPTLLYCNMIFYIQQKKEKRESRAVDQKVE